MYVCVSVYLYVATYAHAHLEPETHYLARKATANGTDDLPCPSLGSFAKMLLQGAGKPSKRAVSIEPKQRLLVEGLGGILAARLGGSFAGLDVAWCTHPWIPLFP